MQGEGEVAVDQKGITNGGRCMAIATSLLASAYHQLSGFNTYDS